MLHDVVNNIIYKYMYELQICNFLVYMETLFLRFIIIY